MEQVWAELRFALDQCAPRLPRDVRRIIMGYAKPMRPSEYDPEPAVRIRYPDRDSGDEAHLRAHLRRVVLRVRPPARVAGA